jgi:acyl-CoA thioesterase I
MTRRRLVLCLAAALAGCARQDRRAEPVEPVPPLAAQPAPADERPLIVAFGDSLTAGHGARLSYTDFLQKELDGRGYRYRVVNQGISGDTTGGGITRIDMAARLRPHVVVLELGANDGLRGLPVEATRANLAEMIDACQRAGARVLLCGMTLPRNYGPEYIRSFEKIFQDLAREKKTPLVPFFLEGVATRSDLMQPDGLHPTMEGNAKVALHVMKYLEPLLK